MTNRPDKDPLTVAQITGAGDQLSTAMRSIGSGGGAAFKELTAAGVGNRAAEKIVHDMVHEIVQGMFNKQQVNLGGLFGGKPER